MPSHSDRKFDVIKFLTDYGFSYKDYGKNVGRDSVNIRCIRCDDKSYHLGIHKEGGYFNCWRCNFSGNFIELIINLLEVSFPKALSIARKYQISGDNLVFSEKSQRKVNIKQLYSFTDYPSRYKAYRDCALSYLKKRFTPSSYLVHCKWFINQGRFGVYLPILDAEFPSAYLLRYIYHFAGCRYYKPHEHNFSKLLFNYQNLLNTNIDQLVIVEGIFDAFSCMELLPTTAIFGTKISLYQVGKIRCLNPKRIIFCLDGNMKNYRRKVEDIVSLFPFAQEKVIIDLPSSEDPGSLGPSKMKEIFISYGVL